MYLGEENERVIKTMNERYHSLFSLAREAVNYSNGKTSEIRPSKNNLQEILVAALLTRLLSALQACVILAERGLSPETMLLSRQVLETTFKLIAIAKSKETADLYAKSDDPIRARILKKLSETKAIERTPDQTSEILTLRDATRLKVDAEGTREINTAEFAKLAGLLDDYHTTYAYFSQSIHVNPKSLEESLEFDASGELNSIKYGPSERDIPDALASSVGYLLACLRHTFELFKIQESSGISVLERKYRNLPNWSSQRG